MKKIKSIFICIMAGVIACMAPAVSYAETNINNVLNRHIHTEDYMWLKEGVTELVHGHQFADTSEDGETVITYDNMEDSDQLLDENGQVIINNQVVQPDDITDQQRELLEYFQNMLKNSERGSNYFTPVETDAYGDWFDNMLAMSGSREEAWMNSMKDSVDYNSGLYTLPNSTDINALYETYAKQLALTKNEWYNLLSKFAKSGTLGFGDNTWLKGGLGIGNQYNVDVNYSGYESSAPKGYNPAGVRDEFEKEYGKIVDDLRKRFENSAITPNVMKLMAYIVPQSRAWWEYIGPFFIALGQTIHAVFSPKDYQDRAAEKERKKIQIELDEKYNAACREVYKKLLALKKDPLQLYTDAERDLMRQLEGQINNMDASMNSAINSSLSKEERDKYFMEYDKAKNEAESTANKLSSSIDEKIETYRRKAYDKNFQDQIENRAEYEKNLEESKKQLEEKQEIMEQGLIIDPICEIGDKVIETWNKAPEYLDAIILGEPNSDPEEYLDAHNYEERLSKAVNNIWTDFINPETVKVGQAVEIPKEDADVDRLKEKFNNATAEQKAMFDAYEKALLEAEEAKKQEMQAKANGDPELEAEWRKYREAQDKIAQEALDKLYDSIGYENYDIPEEYVDLINQIYNQMDDGYRLQAMSLEQEMLAIAKKLKEKGAQYVNKAELEKRMNAMFGDKNVTAFNYNAFLDDYNKVHSKMTNISSDYAPIAFNYFNDASGWNDYKNYIDRLLFGDQYGLKDLGGLNSFYDSGNMTLTVVKEKVLRQVTENVTYYGHFNQDFLWRVENSAGKEVGVYQTDAPEVYLTGGSPDKYHVTENQRADVYLVTARIYGVRYYVFNPTTNTVLASWEEKDMKITPQPNSASSRWVKVWTMTYTTGKSKTKGVKRNSDLWDTQQIQ